MGALSRVGVILAGALAACSTDPTLQVIVQHPTGITIARTDITVYESSSLSCLAIEYGDVSDAALAGAQVASETVLPNAAPVGNLDGISRTDAKLIVARGYGSDGSLVTAGCAEKDTVSGADSVTIATEVAAQVSVSAVDVSRTTNLFGINVAATDATGKSLEGRPVWWRVWGPAGTVPVNATNLTTMIDGVVADAEWQPAQPTCTTNGLATVTPVPPSTVGGFAFQPRVKWATTTVPLISAFTTPELAGTGFASAGSIPPTAPAISRPCAIGRDATGSVVVCLVAALSGTTVTGVAASIYDVKVATSGAPSITLRGVAATWAAPPFPVSIASFPNGSNIDVLTIDAAGGVKAVLGTTTGSSCSGAGCSSLVLDDAVLAPACASDPARWVIHDSAAVLTQNQIKLLPASGGTLGTFQVGATTSVAINAAGCTLEVEPSTGTSSLVQAIALNVVKNANVSRIYLHCAANETCETVDAPLSGTVIGFTSGSGSQMVITDVDATGVLVKKEIVFHGAAVDELIEVSRVPAAAIPTRISVGQFDNDHLADLIWTGGKANDTIELAYARSINGQPLEALSAALRSNTSPAVVDDMLVGDLNGDGFDDIVIEHHEAVLVGTSTGFTYRFTVLPAGVPSGTGTPDNDATCAP